MALITDVKARVSAQRLIELTNPDEPNAVTINDTIFGYAITDVKSIFKVCVGVSFDDTDADHIALAIDGVIIFLMKRNEKWNRATDETEDKWYNRLEILRQTIGGNRRLLPETDSELTATMDKRGVATTIVRPAFDSTRFDRIRPKAPSGGDSSE